MNDAANEFDEIFDKKYREVLDYITDDDYANAEKALDELYDEAGEKYGYSSGKCTEVLYWQGRVYSSLGRLDEARTAYNCVISYCRENLSEDNMLYLRTMLSLAYVEREECDYEKALELSRRAMEIACEYYEDGSGIILNAMEEAAENYLRLDRFDDALALFKHKLSVLEKSNEPDNYGIAYTLNGIGRIYEELRQYDKALECYERGHKLSLDEDGNENDISLNILNNISSIYSDLDMFDKLLEMRKEIYAEAVKVYGENARNTNTAKSNVAAAYYHVGNYAEAFRLYREAYDWAEENLDENNTERQRLTDCLSTAYTDIHDYESALEYARKNQLLCARLYGKDSGEAMYAYLTLSECYLNICRYNAAESAALITAEKYENKTDGYSLYMYLRALDLCNEACTRLGKYDLVLETADKIIKICGENPDMGFDDFLGNAYNAKAEVYCYRKNYDRAVEEEKKGIESVRKINGDEHPFTLNNENSLAEIYYCAGRYDEALELSRKITGICEKTGLPFANTYMKKITLAKALTQKGELDEAEEILDYVRENINPKNERNGAARLDYACAELDFKKGSLESALAYAKKAAEAYSELYGEECDEVCGARELADKIKEGMGQ